jgi:hypothetical protein
MPDFIEASQQNSAALIATAKQAYDWSGVLPAACLPGIAPLAGGALSQTKSQMVQDFKRHKKAMVGLPSSSKGLAILLRKVPVDDDRPSELTSRFFDSDRFLVTRTKTINLAKGRMSLAETVVLKSFCGFPMGMRTNDPTIVLVPDGSWALFPTKKETIVAYRHSSLVVSIKQLNGGTFSNREIMNPSSDDWAALLGRDPK